MERSSLFRTSPLPGVLPAYTALSDGSKPVAPLTRSGAHIRIVRALALSLLLLLSSSFILMPNRIRHPILLRRLPRLENVPDPCAATPRGVSGELGRCGSDDMANNWTDEMLAWQRTAFHFQPHKNWMNDPDAPLYHMGWYHLFYQYNPDSAAWGNITWGHAVSTDLIHWLYLPIALIPDQPFDSNGVWTGSATTLPDRSIIVLYTGNTVDSVQVQNLAYPKNLSDPLLLDWVKYPNNPVITPPPGIGAQNFRDPTTAWAGPNGTWRVAIGSKVNKTGISLLYGTVDFRSFQLMDGPLHGVVGTGMWECVDFYPVGHGNEIKHVLKASLNDDKHDYYAIGYYDPVNGRWRPDNPDEDVGIGWRMDYGKYYASKSFYNQQTGERILWGWSGETDSGADDIAKGWASVQTIPRVVLFDNKTRGNLLQWPVEEVNKLRLAAHEFKDVVVAAGSVIPLQIGEASQLDIVANFELDEETLGRVGGLNDADISYNCSGGAAQRGPIGPFGLLVVASDTLSEQTPIYFYVARIKNGNLRTFFCVDETRSSKASDVGRRVYGSKVPILDGEIFSLRSLVDHSIVESFAQGGRVCITSRVYPTEAILGATRLFIFNNATEARVTGSIKVWHMNSAFIHPFPFD